MRLTRHALAVAIGIPSLAAGQSGTISIHAGTVLDGRGGVTHHTAIVVEGSRIVRLEPAANPVSYDLRGLTVMPGGIDTHVHLTSHFDPNGRAHNDPGGTEPLQRTILYAEENAYRSWRGSRRCRASARRSIATCAMRSRAAPFPGLA